MSGALVVGEILRGNAALTATVPVSHIAEDMVPASTDYPTVIVSTISTVERYTFGNDGKQHVRERVQVTIQANSARERRTIFNLVRAACRYRIGDIAGVTEVTVLLDRGGPSVTSFDPRFFMTTQDLIVAFNEV